MRILLIDIDSLRPDRLGCYGYHRNTSPCIDRLAASGVRLEHCYASDVPCCPSRSSLFSGQYGFRHGSVAHTGNRALRYPDPNRGFVDQRDRQSLPALLSQAGYRCAFISSFPTRHSAWHSLAGFDDWRDTGGAGHELAPKVFADADAWLQQHAQQEDWYCHVCFWDVHTPYRTPAEYGEPFADEPGPVWPDAETFASHLLEPGIRSALDCGWSKGGGGPRQPDPVDSLDKLIAFQNGYDTAIRYVDDHVQLLLDRLQEQGVLEETLLVITADHGEDMGEFGAYGSHCFCGPAVARVPMILHGKDLSPAVLRELYQHFDLAATLLDLAGIERPANWDARPFGIRPLAGASAGRDQVISSNLAQGIQRAVYWQESPGATPHCYLRSWDAFEHPLPEEALIDPADPRTLHTDALDEGRLRLERWHQDMPEDFEDPLLQVLAETEPARRERKERYVARLIESGRAGLLSAASREDVSTA